MKGCARRGGRGRGRPRAGREQGQGPAETRAETKRDARRPGRPAGAAPAPAARSWQRPLPRARSAPNFSFTLSPLPSKKASFWQRRGRRSRSAGSSRRPSGRGSGSPSLLLGPRGDAPLAPTCARRRSRTQPRACLRGPGDTPRPGCETRAGAGSPRGWGCATVTCGHVLKAKPGVPRLGGGGADDAACVAAVRPQPIGSLPGSPRTPTQVPPPTSKTTTQTHVAHFCVSQPAKCGVGRPGAFTRRDGRTNHGPTPRPASARGRPGAR